VPVFSSPAVPLAAAEEALALAPREDGAQRRPEQVADTRLGLAGSKRRPAGGASSGAASYDPTTASDR